MNPKIDGASYFYILSISKDFICLIDFDGKKNQNLMNSIFIILNII